MTLRPTQQVINKRKRAKEYYDRGAKPLPELIVGQPIRVKSRPQIKGSPWVMGCIKAQVAPRSYLVNVNGQNYRRNRVHLRDSATAALGHPVAPPVNQPSLVSRPDGGMIRNTQSESNTVADTHEEPTTPVAPEATNTSCIATNYKSWKNNQTTSDA